MSAYIRSDYSLRRLLPEEWPLLKAIRLEALATDPSVFGNSLTVESLFPDRQWLQRLEATQNAIWGLFFKSKLAGITGIFTNMEDPSEARLTTSFIRAEHRGKGLASLYYDARIAWAKERGLQRLVVTHRAGNEASRAANQRAGFRFTHSEPRTWPDGTEADNLFYLLEL